MISRTAMLLCGAACGLATLAIPQAAWAQVQTDPLAPASSQPEAATGSTIVVTGRLRDQSVQDTPSSVVAVAGEELQSAGIVDIQSLATLIPNFQYATPPGASDNLFVRGLGTTGSGPHFEPAVGQQINGIFTTRSRFGRMAFLDLAQVELLRGPQGAVTGKNTSLGLLNLVPNRPTDRFEASLFAGYDFDNNEGYEVEGVVSGPLSENVRARLAASYKDREGHIENIATGQTSPEPEDFTIRAMLDFDLGDRLSVELMGQYADGKRTGQARELTACNNPAAVAAAFGVAEDCRLDGKNSNVAFFDGVQIPEQLDIEAAILSMTAHYELTDAITLTSITGYTDYDILDQFDSDLSPLASQTIANAEGYEQFSQEVRFSGELAAGVDFIIGALYSEYDLDFLQEADFAVAPGAGTPLRRRQTAQQHNETYSAFADLSFELSPELTVSGGVRYISEDRAATAAQNNLTIFTDTNQFARCAGTDLDGSGLVDQANEFAGGAGFRICSDVSGKETDKDVTFNGNLQYRPIDGTMLYASFATGFKAGGFNLVSGLTQQIASTTFSFEPETTTNYELGGRHEIDVGAADLVFNWTFYRLEIEDQQVSSNDPVIIAQRVTNAGEARSQGVEIDGSLRAGGFRLGFSGAYTDAKYTEYLNAPCFTGQTAAQGCVGGVQDRSGTDITNAPEWQGTGNLSYEFVLGNGMTLTPFAELEYRDGFFTDVDLDPRSIQDSFVKLNASITLAADDERWNIALVGRNLTDEIVQTFSGPTTAVNAFGGGGFYAFSEPGRTIALRGRFNF